MIQSNEYAPCDLRIKAIKVLILSLFPSLPPLSRSTDPCSDAHLEGGALPSLIPPTRPPLPNCDRKTGRTDGRTDRRENATIRSLAAAIADRITYFSSLLKMARERFTLCCWECWLRMIPLTSLPPQWSLKRVRARTVTHGDDNDGIINANDRRPWLVSAGEEFEQLRIVHITGTWQH